jgi:tRNA uridine 5-carboxymethylaminomethyl modification enzyme
LARPPLAVEIIGEVETEIKYAGYIKQAETLRTRTAERHDHWVIPPALDFAAVNGLSNEAREKFEKRQPRTLSEAKRIPGVTPAAVGLLAIHLKRHASGL